MNETHAACAVLIGLGLLGPVGCVGPRVSPAAGCADPMLLVENRRAGPMAVSYQLSGQPPGQRFLVVYLTTHEERDTAIDSLPPISHRPEFLGVVPAGAVRRLGPISGLATGEGPRVRVSVRVYTRGATVSTSVRGPYEPYLVCQTREPE